MSRKRSRTRRPSGSQPETIRIPPVHSVRRVRTTKRLGELAELIFLMIATRMGYAISKPYGDSERYDFILDARRPRGAPRNSRPLLWRIQVKSTSQFVNGMYRINSHRSLGGRAVRYKPGEIDFIVAYIIPEDTWYVVPIRAIRTKALGFRSRKDERPGPYEQYKDAWHLLKRR